MSPGAHDHRARALIEVVSVVERPMHSMKGRRDADDEKARKR